MPTETTDISEDIRLQEALLNPDAEVETSPKRKNLPTNPYSIVRDPFDSRPETERKWVACMHTKSGPVYGGTFDSPEECQKIWDNDVPENAEELHAQGFQIKGAAASSKKTRKKAA